MSQRAGRVEYLLRVTRALLVKTEELACGDTEYLRDEINELQVLVDVLLEKMQSERDLLALRELLHGTPQGGPGEGPTDPGG